jgi:hypothetical protein
MFTGILLLGGCGVMPAAQTPGSPDARVTTSIPEGIYLGEITARTRFWLNGELFSDETETEPFTEVVDANGLPLVQPDGVPPVAGLVLTSDVGVGTGTNSIKGVYTSGNRLVITYTSTIEADEFRIVATGTWTYEYIPPDTLEFLDQVTGSSNVSEFGDRIFFDAIASATLTRGSDDLDSAEPPEGQEVPDAPDVPQVPDVPQAPDLCPNSPEKDSPGVCGCAVADTDADNDGTPDCIDECLNDPNKTEQGICGCGFADADGCDALLARPLDGVIVLDDLSVWSVGRRDEFTVSSWLAGDRVTVTVGEFETSTVSNNRTMESVSAFFESIGTRVTVVVLQDQEFGGRSISFSDGTKWGIFADENESRTWQVGDEVVVWQTSFGFGNQAINLRTGRVIFLSL